MSEEMKTLTWIDEYGVEHTYFVLAKVEVNGIQYLVLATDEEMEKDTTEVDVVMVEAETDEKLIVDDTVEDDVADVILNFLQEMTNLSTKEK